MSKARSRNASALGLAEMGTGAALGPAVARAFTSNGDSAASASSHSPDDSPKMQRGSPQASPLPGASPHTSAALADNSARRWDWAGICSEFGVAAQLFPASLGHGVGPSVVTRAVPPCHAHPPPAASCPSSRCR